MTLRSRGYLPHLESDNAIYFVTFRLAGTLPKSVLESYEFERDSLMKLARQQNRDLTSYEQTALKFLYSQKIQDYLDRSEGECWLSNKRIAQLMIDALKKFNEIRYLLHAWCVMPNHVHVVFHDFSSGSLARIVHSWKSFTAHQANEILKRSGKFWAQRIL